MWPQLRQAVRLLIQHKDNYESCDEGEDAKHCKIEFVHVSTHSRESNTAPSMHLSWRHMPCAVDDLSDEEARALTDAGFDCKHQESSEYIQVIEKKTRHRWLAFGMGGWVISTKEDGSNFHALAECRANPIPTIDVTEEVALYGSLVQHWYMIRQNLPIAFIPLQTQCEDILRVLFAEALLIIKYPKGVSGISIPMGTIQVFDKTSMK